MFLLQVPTALVLSSFSSLCTVRTVCYCCRVGFQLFLSRSHFREHRPAPCASPLPRARRAWVPLHRSGSPVSAVTGPVSLLAADWSRTAKTERRESYSSRERRNDVTQPLETSKCAARPRPRSPGTPLFAAPRTGAPVWWQWRSQSALSCGPPVHAASGPPFRIDRRARHSFATAPRRARQPRQSPRRVSGGGSRRGGMR